MSRPDEYLAIPRPYGDWLGGLKWASNWEAIEISGRGRSMSISTSDTLLTDYGIGTIGLTFAMGAEVSRLLEGLHAGGRPLPFAFVLHLLRLLGSWERVSDPKSTLDLRIERLVEHFRGAGRPLRNAGVMFATICRDVPRAIGPVDLVEVCGFLDSPPTDPGSTHRPTAVAVQPSLEPWEFETRVLQALGRLSDGELRHWLKFGRPPIGDGGETLVREALAALPRTLAEKLTLVERRPRLAGVGPLVRHLAGALSLPSRRLAPAGPPVGGYADITTRGQFEQILPMQLALDPTEFLRRFAEGELLHFHREEPKAKDDEELLLVVDQGVRTWGEVRLVLAAAALAFGRQAIRRRIGLRLTTTRAGSLIEEAAALGVEEIGTRLESSDLSSTPALALERALEDRPDRLRDVVLLTCPRSLACESVSTAARRARPGVRVFGVAVAPGGQVDLAELRHGHPVPVARCRVRIGPAPEPSELPARPRRSPGGWNGDVEAIGYPFALPLAELPLEDRFDFDDSGNWVLMAVGNPGFLYLVAFRGSTHEMLPRAEFDGQPLKEIERVLGVIGGFVVVGRDRGTYIAAHYDLGSRTCTAHRLGPMPEAPLRRASSAPRSPCWRYIRSLHAVAVLAHSMTDEAVYAIDLHARKDVAVFSALDRNRPSTIRAVEAAEVAQKTPPRTLNIAGAPSDAFTPPNFLIDRRDGTVEVKLGRTWLGNLGNILPIREGRPLLRAGKILRAMTSETTLALLIEEPINRRSILLYSLPLLEPSGSYPVSSRTAAFTLSRQGHRLATVGAHQSVSLYDAGSLATPLLSLQRLSPRKLFASVYEGVIMVRAGAWCHFLTWSSGSLEIERVPDDFRLDERLSEHPKATYANFAYPGIDQGRFYSGCSAYGLTLLVDVLGHVVVLDARGNLVALFAVARDVLCGWLPDGTYLGIPSLSGCAPALDAPQRFAAALQAACALGREKRS
jgi:hypothetical protein